MTDTNDKAGPSTPRSEALQRELARLGDEYGPLGVALVAAEQTDKGAIVRQWRANGEDMPTILDVDVAPQREPARTVGEAVNAIASGARRLVSDDTGPQPAARVELRNEVRARIPHLDGGLPEDWDDGYAPAPFQCIDSLDETVTRLDSWVSTFIGRMQPYCKRMPQPDKLGAVPILARSEERSALENRVLLQRDRVDAIIDSLDEMNVSLAL